jgi:hypothetical protein
MSITKTDVRAFFLKLETEAEDDGKKALAAVGQFLRSTMAALAKDPVLTAAIQAGFAGALSGLAAAVETGGAGALPAAALAAGRSLVISAGGTAEHELVPIVAGELHAAMASPAAAVPEHVNP